MNPGTKPDRLRELAFAIHRMADGLFVFVKLLEIDTPNRETLTAAINAANNTRALATRLEVDAHALEAS